MPFPELNFRGNCENVARAYEIALLGNHSITLAYYQSEDGDYERDVNPEDVKIIQDIFGFKSVAKGDLICEVIRPDFDSLLMPSKRLESLEDIKYRVEEAKKHPLPTEFEGPSLAVCESLLKMSYQRHCLSGYDLKIILSVAGTIARLALTPVIHVEHIAEAIQYRALKRDSTVKIYTEGY